jgi:hypothetical protein
MASRAALAHAGAPAKGALAALSRGRHETRVFVRPEGDGEDPCIPFRKSAVCVSDGKGNCVFELDAEHVRRIAAARGRRRGTATLLWFFADGVLTETRETAGRFHIRGDALTPDDEPSEDGGIVARVRVGAAVNSRHMLTEAELVLHIAGKPGVSPS